MKNTTGVLFGRLMKHILRSPDTIITVALVPIVMMLMFVYVFGGAVKMSLGDNVNYVNYQLPGILIMAIASGIAYTAMRLFMDMQKGGLFERFSSMPIGRSSVLWSHVLTSLISNMLTVVIIFLVALIMGFRSSAGILAWLAAAGILVLLTLALTWVAVIPGIMAKSMEGATTFSYPLLFLPFLSSAFVPTETMPKVVRVFAENQPVTSIVESIRALLNSEPVGNNIWIALAWCVGIIVVAYILAMKVYRRRI
ncbi:MAG TPA: ABC transporter permease [Lachnospiraceae bacterium]|jgi:ABC-2 type transport system permease protein|nr:ABC transporter permease [Lachnospiraceae bacterium]